MHFFTAPTAAAAATAPFPALSTPPFPHSPPLAAQPVLSALAANPKLARVGGRLGMTP